MWLTTRNCKTISTTLSGEGGEYLKMQKRLIPTNAIGTRSPADSNQRSDRPTNVPPSLDATFLVVLFFLVGRPPNRTD